MELQLDTDGTIYRSQPAILPTAFGEFTLTVYRDQEDKEHLAIRMGKLDGEPSLVRIHSECLTGDVFGSLRCDCGEQLDAALHDISSEGRGLLLYLRQEGRGIGLNNKILAYALQDGGMDTVEANLHLGFPVDDRSYKNAAAMIKDQGVDAVRLATNNPEKVKALEASDIHVVERLSYQIPARPENYSYLRTKANKMGHLFTPFSTDTLDSHQAEIEHNSESKQDLNPDTTTVVNRLEKSLHMSKIVANTEQISSVTLSYAQSLDGSIAAELGKPLQLSNPRSQALTHRLRSMHDAVLVGINTVLSDDPLLTVRHVTGKNPQTVVLDSQLRSPINSNLMKSNPMSPIIATSEKASLNREKQLTAAGATVLRLPTRPNGLIDLQALLHELYKIEIESLMVEGGAGVITEFLSSQLIDRIILTIAPTFVGGVSAVNASIKEPSATLLKDIKYEPFGSDLVVYAELEKVNFGEESPRFG